MKNRTKIIITVIVTALISSFLTFAAISIIGLKSDGMGVMAKLGTVDAILSKKYLYSYDKNALTENAIKAYVNALDEPYTEYYTPEEFADYTENLQDGYTGIGIIVSVTDDDKIVVVAPFEGSPAYDAGIEPGDIITAVDGTYYTGDELSRMVSVIRGDKEGTVVNISLEKRSGETVNLNVERRDISSNSVSGEIIDGNIGYLKISRFNMESENGSHSTSTEFKAKLSELIQNGADRIIIDLRDNPGGILTEVCAVADELLPEGNITYIEDKNGQRKYYNSDGKYTDVPIAVLINGNSASASEVLTGALKDRDRAVIVGTTSFGKGIVQDVYPLYDGSGISLTTSQYFTPSGICIHDIGISPDITVELPEEYKDMYASSVPRESDTQLNKAIEVIKEK